MRQYDYTLADPKPRPALTGPGESAVPLAPVLQLTAGERCIPQHFLRYDHSRETVEAITGQIKYDPRYPIFVSADAGGIYIQIGIVGPDNYKTSQNKLVYGRKWRVERNLPTSEIIQTVFLALKKAREHELRERFVLVHEGRRTTPFNGHQDLPHMARYSECYTGEENSLSPQEVIHSVKFDEARFDVSNIIELPTGQLVVSLSPKKSCSGEFSQLCHNGLSFICENLSPSSLLHGFFEACLKLSDGHVDEYFQFNGFARFSKEVNIFDLASLSSKQRKCPTTYLPQEEAAAFIGQLKTENYETDETRIPVISNTARNQQLCATLAAMAVIPPPMS